MTKQQKKTKLASLLKQSDARWRAMVRAGQLSKASLSRLRHSNIAPQARASIQDRLKGYKLVKALGASPREGARAVNSPKFQGAWSGAPASVDERLSAYKQLRSGALEHASNALPVLSPRDSARHAPTLAVLNRFAETGRYPRQALLDPRKEVAGLARGNKQLMKVHGIRPWGRLAPGQRQQQQALKTRLLEKFQAGPRLPDQQQKQQALKTRLLDKFIHDPRVHEPKWKTTFEDERRFEHYQRVLGFKPHLWGTEAARRRMQMTKAYRPQLIRSIGVQRGAKATASSGNRVPPRPSTGPYPSQSQRSLERASNYYRPQLTGGREYGLSKARRTQRRLFGPERFRRHFGGSERSARGGRLPTEPYYGRETTALGRRGDAAMTARHEIDEALDAMSRYRKGMSPRAASRPTYYTHGDPLILQREAGHRNFMPRGTQARFLEMRTRPHGLGISEAENMLQAPHAAKGSFFTPGGRPRNLPGGQPNRAQQRELSRLGLSFNEAQRINRTAPARDVEEAYRQLHHPDPKTRLALAKAMQKLYEAP